MRLSLLPLLLLPILAERLEPEDPCGVCTGNVGCTKACAQLGLPYGVCAAPGSTDPGHCCACLSQPPFGDSAGVSAEDSECNPMPPPMVPPTPFPNVVSKRQDSLASGVPYALRELSPSKKDASFFYFEVCGGLTNQKIALVQGLLLARIMGATVILPQLNTNGMQLPRNGYQESRAHLVPFERFYDREATVAALGRLGVAVAPRDVEEHYHERRLLCFQKLPPDFSRPRWSCPPVRRVQLKVERRFRQPAWYARTATHRVELVESTVRGRSVNGSRPEPQPAVTSLFVADCTFFSIQTANDESLRSLFWSIDRALVFATPLRERAERAVARLRALSRERGFPDGRFNALHLRVEEDWRQHCRHWEDPHAGRDNCMTNSEQLHRVLAIEGVSTSPPLFVAGGLSADSSTQLGPLVSLYRLQSKETLTPDLYTNTSRKLRRGALGRPRHETHAPHDCLQTLLRARTPSHPHHLPPPPPRNAQTCSPPSIT